MYPVSQIVLWVALAFFAGMAVTSLIHYRLKSKQKALNNQLKKPSQKENTPSEKKPSLTWEVGKTEYESAMEEYRHYTTIRRQDMAFVTTTQIAILTIIGDNIVALDLSKLLLSFVAFFILIQGLNSELRMSAYLSGYKNRAKDIERSQGMRLLKSGEEAVKHQKFQISNRKMFPVYYIVFMLVWVGIWVINFW